MCGIAGIASEHQTKADLSAIVDLITLDQHSRGPDNRQVTTVFNSPVTIFGHNRLSIIDLSVHAHQPMWDGRREVVVAFNGEIYNYIELREELKERGVVFRTQSDTEVLIEGYRAWGEKLFERIAGMFAFSLLDTTQRLLYFVRDRFGKKPLFYHSKPGEIAWASSSRMLARYYALAPDLEAVSQGILYRVYESNTSIYQNLSVVPAGSFVKVDLNSNRVVADTPRRFYDLRSRVLALQESPSLWISESDTLEQLHGLLVQSVHRRLRADVPIGVSLSGGIDSSSVAALARDQSANLVGFSFGHPTAPQSEGPLVRDIATRLDIPVHYVWPSFTRREPFELLLQTLECQDAPFPTTSMMAQNLVYRAARDSGIRVILGGQGGDEALMGYRKFQLLMLREMWAQEQRLQTATAACWFILAMIHEGANLKAYVQALSRYRGRTNSSRLRLPMTKIELFGTKNAKAWLRQVDDFERFSLPALLRYEDRNSMAHSVESRLPFMDHEFVEFAIALPNRLKIKKGYGKWALRHNMATRLPSNINWARSKRGFDETQNWIAKGLGNDMRNYVLERQLDLDDVLPRSTNIQTDYRDQILLEDGQAFAELVALIWLARRRRGEFNK